MTSNASRFTISRADHVGFAVSSLDRAEAFWVDVMGATLVSKSQSGGEFLREVTGAPNATVRIAMVELAGQRIELLEYDGPARPDAPGDPFDPGYGHIAFIVDDIDALLARIEPHGWRPQGVPQMAKAGAREGWRLIYTRGPDGETVEFLQPPA